MTRRIPMTAVLALAVAASASGAILSQTFEFQPGQRVYEVKVQGEPDRVVVWKIEFDLGGTEGGGLIKRSFDSKAVVHVDNNGYLDQEVGVALVLYDEAGNAVAAGSGGTKIGYLDKGERDRYTVLFPYVYRNLEKTKRFQVTLETREKGSGSPAPTPAP